MYNKYVLKNTTRNSVIAKTIVKKTFLNKGLGLMGKKKPEAIILNTRFGIHTVFLKFPIDVIILNNENKIVKLKKALLPNRIFFWSLKFDTVIELPANSIEKSKTEEGDSIEILL